MSTNYNSKPIQWAKEYKQKLEDELQSSVKLQFETAFGVLYAIYLLHSIKFEEIAILW